MLMQDQCSRFSLGHFITQDEINVRLFVGWFMDLALSESVSPEQREL